MKQQRNKHKNYKRQKDEIKKVIKKLMCGIMVTVLAMSSMSVTKTEATVKGVNIRLAISIKATA